MAHQTSAVRNYFKFKDGQAVLHTTGVVYKLNCSYGLFYIGQTYRNLITRMNEHNPECNNPDQETDVTRHIQYHPDHHHIDFDSPQI